MKISVAWLQSALARAVDTQELAAALTNLGLELASLTPCQPGFSGVVVGLVTSVEAHPNADRLSVCQVDVGSELLTIVCGASNVRAGIRVPVATCGAVLPNGFTIKRTKLRGVASSGMICSMQELGLSGCEANGIMILPEDAPIGACFSAFWQCDDEIIEIELTANRGDCLSWQGLLRECFIGLSESATIPACPVMDELQPIKHDDLITSACQKLCSSFCVAAVKQCDPSRSLPRWMMHRLETAGIMSINPIVDIVNYVMIETGQPMHAYDSNRLDGLPQVRRAHAGESITLLNGETCMLRDSDMVVSDRRQAIALAGVIGGQDSSVSEGTTDIVLESAFFCPVAIRQTAHAQQISTDAAYRFERGVDPAGGLRACQRACWLLEQLLGATVIDVYQQTVDEYLPQPKQLTLSGRSIARLLGVEISLEEARALLSRCQFDCRVDNETLHVQVPTYRFDVTSEIDLVEELARCYGYDRIPSQQPNFLVGCLRSKTQDTEGRVLELLLARGYFEVKTYSFCSQAEAEHFSNRPAICLANPMSSQASCMRPSLIPGLLKAAAYNSNRQMSHCKLFEQGSVFSKEADESTHCCVLLMGDPAPSAWMGARNNDFFTLKGDIMAILSATYPADQQDWRPAQMQGFQSGQTAALWRKGRCVGVVGRVDADVARSYGLRLPVWVFEGDAQILSSSGYPQYSEISKYPRVRRDLSFYVDQALTARELVASLTECGPDWLRDIQIFDVFVDGKQADGKKSISLSLTFQKNSGTLLDEEINQQVDILIEHVQKECSAKLRSTHPV